MTYYGGPSATELQAVSVLSPEVMSQYLVSSGWTPAQRLERAMLWTRTENDGDFQILLPTDRTVRDYASRILDLLSTVATVEDRPIPLILDDLQHSAVDTLAFRLLPSGPSGTIPLFNAADALAGVRELVVASTYALLSDQPMLVQGRRPERALDFARTVRLGTPKAGSWSIAAHLPVPASSADGEIPLARQVSLQMHRAVRACFAASGEALNDYDLRLFLRRTSEGVSANLCEALTKLGRDGVPYVVRFGWAQQLPTTVGSRSFRFGNRQIEVLKLAAEQLKVAVPDGRVVVEGLVSRLRSEPGEAGGQATVRGPITTDYGTSDRPVRVLLPPDLYRRAVDAHGRKQRVRVSGVAVRGRIEGYQQLDVLERGQHTAGQRDPTQ
ncbi:MAG TPA: hypothetical protein VK453_26050 [Micromonosporaceae bacterium]|nr:hypothetical protein [Micromonosporaceae bacterium]